MNIKTFGFKKENDKGFIKKILLKINYVFLIILLVFFAFFSTLDKFSRLFASSDKISELHKNIKQFAIMFLPQDKEFSTTLLNIDNILGNYEQKKDIIKDNKNDLIKIMDYFQKNYTKFYKIGLKSYSQSLEILAKAFDFKEDIFLLLGEKEPQTYIILLQNNSEKRPGGGFFGSYGILRIDGYNSDLKIFDAYYPEYIGSGQYIEGPGYINSLGMTNKLSFVGINKYGFTDVDGQNIIDLYEKIFDAKIRGVVFLDTDFIKSALGDFQQRLWEWQFVNSSIDLIRGENLPFKKGKYLDDINDYIKSNKTQIIKNFLKNFDKIVQGGHIKFYFKDISEGFDNFLNSTDLKTIYSSDKIFCYDYNRSYSKIDGFVDKSIEIYDFSGNLVKNTNNDILDINDLPKGIYKLKIFYTLNVSDIYQNYIHSLEDKYKIQLGDKQKHILGLNYLRDNQAIIYFPKNIEITDYTGDYYQGANIYTDFSKIYSFNLKTQKNNDIKSLEIDFKK